jgi:hypothetical protein
LIEWRHRTRPRDYTVSEDALYIEALMLTREEQEEDFIHFVSCIEDLNDAWMILKRVKRRKSNSLAYTAFKFALIAYSRPYKISYGKVKNKHKGLGEEYVPPEYITLHNQILTARDTFLAHSDLTIKEAQLYVSKHAWGKETLISQNVINAAVEYSKIDGILDLIEKTLIGMYEKEKLLKADLRPNSRTR